MRSSLELTYRGKVKDCYRLDVPDGDSYLILVVTDRLSAFNRYICDVPGKGEILARLSEFWFTMTRHVVDNHFVRLLSPRTCLVQECRPVLLEVVVRGYLTGLSAETSLATMYDRGLRRMYGYTLPDGLRRNDPLPEPMVTVTTKGATHDIPLTPEAILEQGHLDSRAWDQVREVSLMMFRWATSVLLRRGLILADSKYEFGYRPSGELVMIDELHTPDSCRLWDAYDYPQAVEEGRSPRCFDKDVARLMLQAAGYPGRDAPPSIDIDRIAEAYHEACRRIIGD